MDFKPRRSVLFTPSGNQRALEKARTLPVDALVLDLEDSIAPSAKDAARDRVCATLRERPYGRREVVVRINALDTPWGGDDLAAVCDARPDAILLPKVASVRDVLEAGARLEAAAGSDIGLWLMIETPRAVLDIGQIAGARARVPALAALVIGANDIAKETRVRPVRGRATIMPWLMQIVLGGRAYGLDVIDAVYNDHADITGFREECEQAHDLGMDGKSLIHPGQIVPCTEAFAPGADDIAWAEKVVEAFRQEANADLGVISVDGRMVERLHLAMAHRVLAMAAAPPN